MPPKRKFGRTFLKHLVQVQKHISSLEISYIHNLGLKLGVNSEKELMKVITQKTD